MFFMFQKHVLESSDINWTINLHANIFMQEILLVQVSKFVNSLFQSDLRGLNVCCVPLGFYGIDPRQHPQVQLISDATGLDDSPERFVGSK